MQIELFCGASRNPFEPYGSVCHRLLRRSEVGERVNLVELFGGRFPICDDASQGNAWKSHLVAKLSDLSNAFAHECLTVDCALGSDNEIGVAEAIFQARLLGEKIEARGDLRPGEGTEAKAKATCGASAGCVREIQIMLLPEHRCESVQATFGERKISGTQALLGTIDPRATFRTEQRILHIHCDCDLREGQSRNGGPQPSEILQFYPTRQFSSMPVVKIPTDFPGKPETSVIGSAPANSNDALASAAVRRRAEHDSESTCVQVKRVVFTARQLREADDASGLDDRSGRFNVPPPTGRDGAVGCVHRVRDNWFSADERAHDLAKSIAAVAHRQ